MTWMSSFRRVPVGWTTTKSVDQVVDALRHAGLRGPGELVPLGGPLSGKVRPPKVVARRRTSFNNSLGSTLVGTLAPADGGARLTGRLGPNPFALALFVIWIVLASAFPFIAASAAGSADVRFSPMWLVLPLLGVALAVVGMRMGATDRVVIRSAIADALGVAADGTDAPAITDPPSTTDPPAAPPARPARPGPYTSSPSTGEGTPP